MSGAPTLDEAASADLAAPRPGLLVAETTAIQTVASAAVIALPAMAPLVAASVGLKESLVGLQIGLLYCAATLSSLVAGGLVRRLGGCRTGQVAMLLTALGLGVEAVGSAAAIAAGSIVVGVAYGLPHPAASHLLRRWTPVGRRNLVFSLKQTGAPLGGVAAGLIAPPMAQAFGWRSFLAALAASALAIAVLSQAHRRASDADRDRGARVWAGPLDGLWLIWRSAPLRAITLAAFCFAGVQMSAMTFLVAYLSDEVGIGLVAAGAVLAAAQGGALCGRMLWGWVADRLRAPLEVLGLLGAVMAAACLLLASLQAGWGQAVFFAAALLAGTTAVGWNGVFQAEVARLTTDDTIGVATGGAMFVIFMGALAAPSAVAGLYEVLGSYRAIFVLLGLSGAAGGLLALVARRRATAPVR